MSFDDLAASLRGDLVTRESANYDEVRAIYNAMIDKKPAALARCVDAADVQTCVNYARDNGVPLAIRGGGHNAGGLGLVDDGLVIDLSPMRGIRVDPKKQTIRVQGGCRWGDVDHAGHPYGLTVPAGIISTTGCGGLTLGGGLGHLSRKYGLTIDNLLEADVVLADGSMVVASADENSDLFWALRGGGGNFGVVTSFLYRAAPVKNIFGGPTLWSLDRTEEIMKWYREFILQAPEELTGFFAFLTVPPGPPFPEHLHLKKMCGVVWCYSGDMAKAEELFAPILALKPDLPGVGEMPMPALNSAFDPVYPPGHQWYWQGRFLQGTLAMSPSSSTPNGVLQCPPCRARCTSTPSTARSIVWPKATRLGATARPTGPESSSASIPTPPTRTCSATGRSAIGTPSIHIHRVAPMSTS